MNESPLKDQTESREKALGFLRNNPIGVISTLDELGHPQSAAIAFIVDEYFRFYFFTRTNTKKYRNIQRSEFGALCVVNEDDLLTVQAEGSFLLNISPDRAGEMVNKLTNLVGDPIAGRWPPPVAKIRDGSMALISFTPRKLRFADFRERQSDNSEYFFDLI